MLTIVTALVSFAPTPEEEGRAARGWSLIDYHPNPDGIGTCGPKPGQALQSFETYKARTWAYETGLGRHAPWSRDYRHIAKYSK